MLFCDLYSMRYYPRPSDAGRVHSWILRNIDSYSEHRHGLWAVVLKNEDILIGDCGKPA